MDLGANVINMGVHIKIYEPKNANLLDTKQQIAELSRNATENTHKAATQCPLIRKTPNLI
ncbi:hypothetical protein [Paraglaciecola chathamensis]|uniref:hypothetical protein n=1 Tax=Paraglaciecola chathamensis TaxID=368405 RepID=UPI002989DD25|nr:hypothetical protein [Paraglaciecola chathamensis]